MRRDSLAAFIKTSLFLWAALCIVIYLDYSIKVSIIHSSNLDELGSLPAKLAGFPVLKFFLDLVLALIQYLLFSAAAISTGALAAWPLWNRRQENNSPDFSDPLVRLGSAFLLGHLVFSTIFILMAAGAALKPLPVAAVLSIGFLAGIYPSFKFFIQPLQRSPANPVDPPAPLEFRILTGLSLVILALGVMLTSSQLGYDAVYIYFSDPKLTALSGRLGYFLNDLFVISSFQTGIEFSALMLLFGDQAARLFSWTSGCFFVALSLGLARQAGISSRARSILLAMLVTSTAFMDLLGDGKVDLTSSAIALASVYWMVRGRDPRDLLLSGIFAGLAMASRPFNTLLIGLFVATFHVAHGLITKNGLATHRLRALALSLAWISAGALPPLLLHLFENWLVLENPLAMLVNTVNISADKWQWAFDPQTLWLRRLFYPFVVTYLNSSQSIGTLTPFFISFLPGLMIGEIRRRVRYSRGFILLLVSALVTLTAWITLYFTIAETRYVFFLWAILFMGMAEVAAASLMHLGRLLGLLTSAVMILLLFVAGLRTIYISLDAYAPLDSHGNPTCGGREYCEYLAPINEQAGEGERVLSLLAYRYYLRTDLFACSTKLDEYHRLIEASRQDPQRFWEEIYRQGYSYIAYEKNYSVRHLYMDFVPGPDNVPSWMQLETLAQGPNPEVAAYKISVLDPPFPLEKKCSPVNGSWEIIDIHK